MEEIKTKRCSKCGIEKSLGEFGVRRASKDGLALKCNQCRRDYYKEHREERVKYTRDYYNRNRDHCSQYNKKYRENHIEECKEKDKRNRIKNREKRNEQNKQWQLKNKEKVQLYRKQYNKENRDKINIRVRERMRTDTNYKIAEYLRHRLYGALKDNYKSCKTLDYLGCSVEDCKKHLESQFKEGMSWDNYGKDGWDIDHIIPCSSFDLEKEEEIYKMCHYSNLQPMWHIDNLKKGNKVT